MRLGHTGLLGAGEFDATRFGRRGVDALFFLRKRRSRWRSRSRSRSVISENALEVLGRRDKVIIVWKVDHRGL